MKNILFFSFNEILASNGISKKIGYQCKALSQNDNNVYLMYTKKIGSNFVLYINDTKILESNNKLLWSFKLLPFKKEIMDYIEKNNIEYVYVRYTQFASFSVCRLFKEFKKNNLHVALEIPSYPYDNEFRTLRQKTYLLWERFWRRRLSKYIDIIITFSNYKNIWGCNTLKIKNAIDFSNVKVRTENKIINKKIEIIAVAGLAFWHGFDRIIEGLNIYYSKNKDIETKVHLNIVGVGYIDVYNSLINLVNKYNLNDYVTFSGEKFGDELDSMFENSDIAIGCLGCHRKNIKEISSLKNVEYAARGIPFIYSEINPDFDKQIYVKKEKPDESPIDIEDLIEWRKNLSIQPLEIRNSIIKNLSWEKQMNTVLNQLDNNTYIYR